MSKRGGGEAVRSCRAAAGGWVYLEIQGGARITQGGANAPPASLRYTPDTQVLRACRVVTWFVPGHVSRGYMVCAHVAWLHGLRPCVRHVVTWIARWTATAARSWRDFVSEDTRTTCRYLDRVKMNVAQYHVWPNPRASTL